MTPDRWIEHRIEDLGTVDSGRQRSRHIVEGVPRPYLRVANVYAGYIDVRDVLTMPFTDSEFERHVLRPGDVLLNEGQSRELVGRSAVYRGSPRECAFQNTLIRFRPNGMVLSDFAHHLFEHLRLTGRFSAIASQTTSIAHLGVDRFAKLKVRVPSTSEQAEIASVLNVWSHAENTARQLLKQCRKLKRGLLQQLLTGERRFPEFRDQPWVERRFGDFLTESRIPGSHGAAAKKLSIRLYGKGMYVRTDNRDGSEQTQYYRRSAGQLVYSKLDFLNGAFGIVPASLDGYESTLDVPAFDIASDTDPRWLLYLVTFDGFYKRQLGLAHGGRKARRVNPDAFLGLALPMPTRAEQARIADALEDADREIQLLTDLHEALKEQKKGLMQQLLTGKVRVPASMLKETAHA